MGALETAFERSPIGSCPHERHHAYQVLLQLWVSEVRREPLVVLVRASVAFPGRVPALQFFKDTGGESVIHYIVGVVADHRRALCAIWPRRAPQIQIRIAIMVGILSMTILAWLVCGCLQVALDGALQVHSHTLHLWRFLVTLALSGAARTARAGTCSQLRILPPMAVRHA